MKYFNEYQKRMYGRNGIDELNKFLLIIYLIVVVLNIFFKTYILFFTELILIAIIIFRFLSKKINKRSKENKIYLKVKNKLYEPFKLIKMNKNDLEKVYKKCHYCKTILKLPLPSKKGIKHVKCPECKKRNTFLILKKEKIEIIKNKK